MKRDMIDMKHLTMLQDIRRYFNDSTTYIHKARNEIKVVEFEDESLVIKSFKVPNIINKIIYTFFKSSKAKKSYDNSIQIINFVPKPIGFVEFKQFGLISDSYFISENFNYDFTIREPLINESFENKENIFKSFAKFTLELHEAGIFHLDYSPGNILIKKEDDSYIFKIVDINRMQFKTLSQEDRLRNFSKLWAKDSDLTIIIKEYSKLTEYDEHTCINSAIKYSQSHKDKKNTKKRLRGQKVVD
ncbi:hypothetical protein N9A28_09235 [Sulfurimonas sp.]|nr:hypothetical protein [Sulfurimonas sp.]